MCGLISATCFNAVFVFTFLLWLRFHVCVFSPDALLDLIRIAMDKADVVVASGGVSMGDKVGLFMVWW